jgi:hypothetical protein
MFESFALIFLAVEEDAPVKLYLMWWVDNALEVLSPEDINLSAFGHGLEIGTRRPVLLIFGGEDLFPGTSFVITLPGIPHRSLSPGMGGKLGGLGVRPPNR